MNIDFMKRLAKLDLPMDKMVAVIEIFEDVEKASASPRSSNAERQARFRNRKNGNVDIEQTTHTVTGKVTESNAQSNATVTGEVTPPRSPFAPSSQVLPTPLSFPSPPISPSTPPAGNSRRRQKLTEPTFPDDLPEPYRASLSLWFSYKIERREAYKPIGWQTLINQQRKFSAARVAAGVEFSMANNYAGLLTEKTPEDTDEILTPGPELDLMAEWKKTQALIEANNGIPPEDINKWT